ncbi:protein DOG1-like 3 [Amaranthus tricolor]|uniref:protein DOG1-like 3 n=1 Tax=Amaranthus tricolor TaxID=29722 RepID=UPI00258414BF|nr:protein DOG1-like 3 [Amaranthus tricolor]
MLPSFKDLEAKVRFKSKESFTEVFDNWLILQKRSLDELRSAAKAYPELIITESHNESTQKLAELVNRVMSHYKNYYRVKSESMKQNALQMLSATWRSNLESAFLWIGGWRPSMAFHLLFSISGLQLEDQLSELIQGLETGDLRDLSSSQLIKVNELQRQTVKEERELTESLASQQETVADSSMVELSRDATALTCDINSGVRERVGNGESVSERVEIILESKEDKLEEIFRKADDLRLRTLKKVVEIFSPIQAVHFLIAAAELHLKVHEWGMKKDAQLH